MPCDVNIMEPTTLLEDLLEDSARVFHRKCATIQRTFHVRWRQLVGELVGILQIENPDANPTLVAACARNRLRACREVLRKKQGILIQEERDRRFERDAAIHAYVASVQTARQTTAVA